MIKKRIGILLCMICLAVAGPLAIRQAEADIPKGVKDTYRYNTHESSIIIVKERLQELGYFGADASFSDFVSEQLKTAVINFQNKNKMKKANGTIDKELLELLFSDDAIGKNGQKVTAKATATPKPTKKKATETKKSAKATESKKKSSNSKEKVTDSGKKASGKQQQKTAVSEVKDDRLEVVRPWLIPGSAALAGLLIFLKLVAIIRNQIRKNKLITILIQYRDMHRDTRAYRAIRESELDMGILAEGGEYLFIPLKRKITGGYTLRFSRKNVASAEEKTRTNVLSILDNIARVSLSEKANRKLCKAWGRRKKGRGKRAGESERYVKLMQLYTSLRNNGIIRGKEKICREAFYILAWESALENVKELRNEQKDFMNGILRDAKRKGQNDPYGVSAFTASVKIENISNSYLRTVYMMYEIGDLEENDLSLLLTAREYLASAELMWYELRSMNRKKVRLIVEEIEKRRKVPEIIPAEKETPEK